MPEVPWITPGAPPQKEFTPRLISSPAVTTTPHFPEPQEKSFKARRAIPAHDEPLDDTWKARHRDLRRKTRRVRKAESVAQSFLESRAFRIARVALILASAGMLVWLFTYMQNNQWRLPGMSSNVAGQGPAATSGVSRPLGSDANIFTGDDDTEIPPAASFPPGPPASVPLAGSPR